MADEAGFANRMNGLPKYVTTNTLTAPEWNANLVPGDPAESIRALKSSFDGTLLLNGSQRLFSALHDAGLVDEYRFMIYPVVVGDGRRLFDPGAGTSALDLTNSQITASGVAILTYRPA